jgi:Tfp pilus assembly protein PilF
MVARTRESGILVVFTLFVCASTSAQTTLIDQGRAALLRNDAETAVNLLEKAVAQSPNNAEAHHLLGDAYGTLAEHASIFKMPGLARKAHAEFERAVQLDPNYLDARFALIEFYMLAPGFLGGSEEKAIAQANEIKKRDAIDGHRAFALIYQHQKKPDLARKEYVEAVKEQPNSPKARYWLGVSYYPDKNYKAAAIEFETAVRLDPSYMPGWFQIGHVAALSGSDLDRGEEALRKYLTYTPGHDDPPVYRAHYWLGAIYEKLGKKSAAKASYATSLRLNPSQKDVAEALKRLS